MPSSQFIPLDAFDDCTTPEQKDTLFSWLRSHGPDDRHLVVSDWNWDHGGRIPMWIVRQPDCDRATALLAFWMNDPSDVFADRETYDQYHSDEAGDPRVAFCTEVLERWLSGFYRRSEILLSDTEQQTIRSFRAAFERTASAFPSPELVWELPPDFVPARSGRTLTTPPPYEILPL
jgi:hypothetical protein